jgi:hypothetical protein
MNVLITRVMRVLELTVVAVSRSWRARSNPGACSGAVDAERGRELGRGLACTQCGVH